MTQTATCTSDDDRPPAINKVASQADTRPQRGQSVKPQLSRGGPAEIIQGLQDKVSQYTDAIALQAELQGCEEPGLTGQHLYLYAEEEREEGASANEPSKDRAVHEAEGCRHSLDMEARSHRKWVHKGRSGCWMVALFTRGFLACAHPLRASRLSRAHIDMCAKRACVP